MNETNETSVVETVVGTEQVTVDVGNADVGTIESSTVETVEAAKKPKKAAKKATKKPAKKDKKPAKAKAEKVVKPTGECYCGCKQTLKPRRQFRQGHDARFHGNAKKVARGQLGLMEAMETMPKPGRDMFRKEVASHKAAAPTAAN